MQDSSLLLGIDVGTTNCKALVFDTAGNQRAAASAPTPVRQPRPGWAEHDPEALWQAVVNRRVCAVWRWRAWPRLGCCWT